MSIISRPGLSLSCIVSGKRTLVELVKRNNKTCLVRLSDGNIIKRHFIRHKISS